jgi:hypothetical protein
MADSYSSRPNRNLNIVVQMVFSLSCVVSFLEVHVGIFLDDFVANSNIRLH